MWVGVGPYLSCRHASLPPWQRRCKPRLAGAPTTAVWARPGWRRTAPPLAGARPPPLCVAALRGFSSDADGFPLLV